MCFLQETEDPDVIALEREPNLSNIASVGKYNAVAVYLGYIGTH